MQFLQNNRHELILERAFDTPWKASNNMLAWLSYPYVRLLFALNGITWNRGWRIYGLPIIQKHRLSIMRFGPGLNLRSTFRSNPLCPNHPVLLATWQTGSRLDVGCNFAMTGGVLCAAERITIGNNVVVGANSTIVDTDFHPLDALDRRISQSEGSQSPVVIEDEVFVGMNCLILKGVTIGKGSVLGAGSVLTQDLPPGVIAAGNPARVIRNL